MKITAFSLRMSVASAALVFGFACVPAHGQGASKISAVWANEGGDKVLRHERRAASGSVTNSVWDGAKIRVFAARNETVNFNVVLESAEGASEVAVALNRLTGPDNAVISSPGTAVRGDAVFNWAGRNIELFVVQYLQIRGLSKLSYDAYDERHVPSKMRRPGIDAMGGARGGWSDRPGADKYFPEIAVPHELRPTFAIPADSNQSVWVDVYVPRAARAGTYAGALSVRERGREVKRIPVELTVRNFTLPDTPAAKTMLAYGAYDISERYTGRRWADPGTGEYQAVLPILEKHWQMMRRHRITPVDDVTRGVLPIPSSVVQRLDGSVYRRGRGYDGPGEGRGDDVYPIGFYGNWSWKDGNQAEFNRRSDEWVNYFERNLPDVDYFLYLIDEPDHRSPESMARINGWIDKLQANPGPGRRLRTMVTMSTLHAMESVPRLNIASNWYAVADTVPFQTAVDKLMRTPGNEQHQYNGKRPASGSFAIEDDGTSPRMLPWAQSKKGIGRWFFWESTYYNDFQTKVQQVNVWQNANTYGKDEFFDASLGRQGFNYSNGDGVLFYPGTDRLFPADSLGVNGPIASLRLKYWRRGIQDADYVALAKAVDPAAAAAIVNRMVPKVLWEVGVQEASDPSWLRADISWSIDPDAWERARRELADIIETGSRPRQPAISVSGG
jgi:hypothetical protein